MRNLGRVLAVAARLQTRSWAAIGAAPRMLPSDSIAAPPPRPLVGLIALGRWLGKLQREPHAGVEEHLERGVGHDQQLGDTVERQLDLERVLLDREVPEPVLEDDHHLLRILVLEASRHADTGSLRIEGDIEMVIAGQAGLEHLHQHATHDAAHGILHQGIVVDGASGGHADPSGGVSTSARLIEPNHAGPHLRTPGRAAAISPDESGRHIIEGSATN